jgi:hypothetical protein
MGDRTRNDSPCHCVTSPSEREIEGLPPSPREVAAELTEGVWFRLFRKIYKLDTVWNERDNVLSATTLFSSCEDTLWNDGKSTSIPFGFRRLFLS